MWCYTLLPKILNMSLTAGLVIVLVLLARLPLKKAPKIFSYVLWAVVLFRLLCPVSLSADFSLLGVFHAPTVTKGSITYIPTDIVHRANPEVDLPLPGVSEIINDTLPQGAEQTVTDPLEVPMAMATLLWFGGIAALLSYSAVSLLALRRKLIGAVPLRENIYLADHIATPFVMGVIRPKIYLPSTLSEQEQGYILLHEQTHIRRLDHIVKLLAFLALAVHWFNPLVWVAFVCSANDMEMSCDEAVMKEMGDGIRSEYSASLLSLATGRKTLPGTPLAFGEENVKGRIKNLLNYKKPPLRIMAGAVIVVIVLGSGLLSNPREKVSLMDSGIGSYKPALMVNGTIYWLGTGGNMKALPEASRLSGKIQAVSQPNAPPDENLEAIGLSKDYVGRDFYISSDGNMIFIEQQDDAKAYFILIAQGAENNADVLLFTMSERLKQFPDQYGNENAEEDGVVSILQGRIYEGTRNLWDSFIERTAEGKASQIIIAGYTIEGDPIFKDVVYDGRQYFAAVDPSRDRFKGDDEDYINLRYDYLKIITHPETGSKFVVLTNKDELTFEELRDAQIASDMESIDSYQLFSYSE